MKTLICIENESYSQFNYDAIKEVNSYIDNSIDEISFVALDKTNPFMSINTAVYTPNELDSFNNGLIIFGNIKMAKDILKCNNKSQKILYLYDLNWMFEQYMYDYLYEILTDPQLKVIIRNESYVQPLKNLCNREPDGIINNFDLEKIWNLL